MKIMNDPIKKAFPHNILRIKKITTKLHEEKPSEEFTFWYERFYLQSPSLCALKYDDEKMWEAWKAGYKLGCKNDLEL